MHKSIRSLAAALAFTVMPFMLGLVVLPGQALANAAVDVRLFEPNESLQSTSPNTDRSGVAITLTNLRTGSTHGDTTNEWGIGRIEDVPPGYYQVRIQGRDRYHIDYVTVTNKNQVYFSYRWRDLHLPLVRSGQTDAEIIRGTAADIAVTTQRGFTKWREESISDLSQVQEIHRQALKRLESLGPKAIRAVGPPLFNKWRQIHQRAIDQVNTAYDQATRPPTSTGAESTSERRAALEEQQSHLLQQRQSQTAEIATFAPKFLERRQYLLEKLPPTLQTNLTRGGGTDSAGHAAVTRTRLQIQIELQDANASADLVRLKLLYEQMAGYYTALFDTESKIAQVQKDIAHTIVDEKDYATGGGDGGGGGEGGGGGGGN